MIFKESEFLFSKRTVEHNYHVIALLQQRTVYNHDNEDTRAEYF
jgi:hypothetical protein